MANHEDQQLSAVVKADFGACDAGGARQIDRVSRAKDRAGLYQILATTLQHYGINLNDAATGIVNAAPVVPGLEPAPPSKEPSTTPPPSQ